jgi:hypothetical protein
MQGGKDTIFTLLGFYTTLLSRANNQPNTLTYQVQHRVGLAPDLLQHPRMQQAQQWRMKACSPSVDKASLFS